MVMQNKPLIFALYTVLINNQYASNMYANKQLVRELLPKLKCYPKF